MVEGIESLRETTWRKGLIIEIIDLDLTNKKHERSCYNKGSRFVPGMGVSYWRGKHNQAPIKRQYSPILW